MSCSDLIVTDDLPETVLEGCDAVRSGRGAAYHQSVLEAKRRLILDAIGQACGNYTAAARRLGINPPYLHRLVKNLQLKDMMPRR